MPETDRYKQQLTDIQKDVAEIKQLLTGNGHPSQGLIVRVDRLEQTEKGRTWVARATFAIAIGAAVKFLVSLIK